MGRKDSMEVMEKGRGWEVGEECVGHYRELDGCG